MIIFYLIIAVLALIGVRKRKTNEDIAAYLSKDSTNAIKGIFILTVFLRHANQYVRDSGYVYNQIWDKLFVITNGLLGQLIVVMFLFFSGYGVMLSIKKKGDTYVKKMPKHRVLNTLLNFDVAIIFFLLLAFFTDREFTWSQVLLAFVGWESLGNSTWYIFIIIICYFVTWISFGPIKYSINGLSGKACVAIISAILLLVIVLLNISGKDPCWYDTILCYPLGMLLLLYKDRFEKFVSKRNYYLSSLVLGLFLFVFSFVIPHFSASQMNSWGGWILRVLSMILVIVLLMRKIKIGNSILIWLGNNLFPLYIYQRIPMILVSSYFTTDPYILFGLSFVLTFAFVPIYKRIEIKI